LILVIQAPDISTCSSPCLTQNSQKAMSKKARLFEDRARKILLGYAVACRASTILTGPPGFS